MKKWIVFILTLCSVLGLIGCNQGSNSNYNSNLFGDGDATLFEPHREDFSSVIENFIIKQFEDSTELKKAYILRTNDWFLADVISDFSQVVTTDSVYVIPGGEENTSNDKAYSFYNVNEGGKVEWVSSAYSLSDASVPFGFSGLTYELIDNALASIEYEDYIITYAQRLNTVLVWVRGVREDLIITYPTRPDLLGIEVGGLYTVEELKEILTEAYSK